MPEFGTELFGEPLFGGEPVGGPPETPIAEFLIDGSNYTDDLLADGFDVSLSVDGGVSTLRCNILLASGDPPFSAGLPVAFSYDSGAGMELIFSGYIATMEPRKQNAAYASWSLTCQDHMRLLASVQTGVAVFSSATDKSIIQSLFAEHMPSVNTDNVDHVITVSSIDLANKSLRECMDAIIGRSRAVYYLGPDLKLYYHDVNTRTAPFALYLDSPNPPESYTVQRSGVQYQRSFSNPVNRAVVRNILAEDTTLSQFTPPDGGSDGEVKRVGATFPPSGSYTASTAATTFMAERAVAPDPTPSSQDYTPPASGDDGYVSRSGSSYPPTGSTTVNTGASFLAVERSKSLSTYYIATALVRFDTSGIPQDATITGADITLTVQAAQDDDGGSLFGISWASPNIWPIDSSDYTPDYSSTAVPFGDFVGGLSGAVT